MLSSRLALFASSLLLAVSAHASNDEHFYTRVLFDNQGYDNPYQVPAEDTSRSATNNGINLVSSLEWQGDARFLTYANARSDHYGTVNTATRTTMLGRVQAESVYEKVVKNYGGTNSLKFHFNMSDILLSAGGWDRGSDFDVSVGYEAQVFLNGREVWNSALTLHGIGYDDYTEVSKRGEDLGLHVNLNPGEGAVYFGSYAKELDLGVMRGNETATITYRLSTFSDARQAMFCNWSCSWAHAVINDPAGAALDRVVLTPVPEADTWAMLSGGLVFLGVLARRRRQA